MELYHVLNRGVDKRTIFLDGEDYARFVHDLWEFNDKNPVNNVRYHMRHSNGVNQIDRKPIVDIHGWCLMKNHYHLLISEKQEGGLTLFLRKLNVGYANYFNERYDRDGALFQGRTKKILIDTDAHFLHILHYIHLNPLDYHRESRQWREQNIQSAVAAMRFLKKYRWSSFLDYSGTQNFPSVLSTKLFSEVFENIEKETKSYLSSIQLETMEQYLLE